VDMAQRLIDNTVQLRRIMKEISNDRGSTQQATKQKRHDGERTRKTVIGTAKKMKQYEPKLSKSEVARRIARIQPAPCKYDQAKNYLDEEWDRSAWAALGSHAR
jgi:hypothetical protein